MLWRLYLAPALPWLPSSQPSATPGHTGSLALLLLLLQCCQLTFVLIPLEKTQFKPLPRGSCDPVSVKMSQCCCESGWDLCCFPSTGTFPRSGGGCSHGPRASLAQREEMHLLFPFQWMWYMGRKDAPFKAGKWCFNPSRDSTLGYSAPSQP